MQKPRGLEPDLEQVPEELVALLLGVHEHEHLALLLPLAQELQKPHESLVGLSDLDVLGDVRVDHAPATDLDLDGRFQDLLGQSLHLQLASFNPCPFWQQDLPHPQATKGFQITRPSVSQDYQNKRRQ